MSTGLLEVGAVAPTSPYVTALNKKLTTGEYAQEWVSCFCGSENGKKVTDHDRYGVQYQARLCLDCGLIYASPRMTHETLQKFYTDEYRQIFHHDNEDERIKNNGEELQKTLEEHFGFIPHAVLDVGCHTGGMLEAFRGKRALCRGVEINDIWPTGKFDLIILNHVLEHVTDLHGMLEQIRNTVMDDGYVFIGLPGTFYWNREELWQCAHTYQFCLETLYYVMECCGFEAVYATEHINSLWKKSSYARDVDFFPPGVAHRTDLYLQGKPYPMPDVHTFNKFSIKEREENIRFSLSQGKPDIQTLLGTSLGKAIIVSGGPSIEQEIGTIQSLSKAGAEIFCIERMVGWCVDHHITPDYVVCVDASDDVVESLREAPTDPTYLLSSQVVRGAWEALEGRKVVVFNGIQVDVDQKKIWEEYGYDHVSMVNAGGSVTLASMTLAIVMGAREVDIFGFDCHMTDKPYAEGIRGVGVTHNCMTVDIHGRKMVTTAPYVSFAQDYYTLIEIAEKRKMIDRVTVHGDSLINAVKP